MSDVRLGFRSVAWLAAMVTVLTACGGTTGGTPASNSFELKIGLGIGFTGGDAVYAQPTLLAIQYAADLVNQAAKKAGLQTTVKIFSEDTQSTPTGATEAAVKLVQVDQVSVIIGSVTTSETIPMSKAAATPNQVVQISLATSPLVTDVDDNDFLWRTTPSDAAQAPKLAQYMATIIGKSATVNTLAGNSPGFAAFQRVFNDAWTKQGGKIGQSVTYDPTEPSFDTDAQKLVSGNPDAWMIYDISADYTRFAPALIRTGKWDSKKTFSGDALKISSLPKDAGALATEGISGTSLTTEGAPAGPAFDKLWNSKTSVTQQYAEPNAFDAVLVSYLAALRGGSAKGKVIRDNLRQVSNPPGTKYTFEQIDDAIKAIQGGQKINYEGASGPCDFDAKGDPTGNFYQIWKFVNGEIKILNPKY